MQLHHHQLYCYFVNLKFLRPYNNELSFPDNQELTVPASGIEYFSINPIPTVPSFITIDWYIDEQPINQGSTNLELEASLYSEGEHEVKVVVKDLSSLF